MSEISIGDAVGAGFSLIRRRPGSVLVWGLIQTAVLALFFAAMAPMYGDLLSRIGRPGAPASVAPGQVADMLRFQALSYLLNFISLFVNAVLYCAVFRAIIYPDRGRFWFLRLGATELLLFVMLIAAYIGFLVALFIIIIPSTIVVAALVMAHATAAAVIVGILIGVACFFASTYVVIRFSLVGPMMVEDGKIHIFDAWALTQGRAGALFLIGLCVFALLAVAEVVVFAVLGAVGFGLLVAVAGGVQAVPALFSRGPAAVLSSLGPLLLVLGLAVIPLYGALLSVMGAPLARAYLDLRARPEEAF